jgi:hypothetical protein
MRGHHMQSGDDLIALVFEAHRRGRKIHGFCASLVYHTQCAYSGSTWHPLR